MKKYLSAGLSFFMVASFLVFVPTAFAADTRNATVSISPTSSTTSQNKSYTVTINNSTSSNKKIKEVKITIPTGFTSVSGISIGGDASGWNSTSSTSTLIWVKGGNDITPNHSLTVTFSATAPASAGSYQWTTRASEDFSDSDKSFNITSAQPTVVVSAPIKTNPTLSITNSPVTYTGSVQSATVVGSVAGTVSNIQYNAVPTNVGTYAVTANFVPTDTANYNSLTNATVGNFVINKASSATTVTCSDVTYNGSVQTPCTATVTGAGGLSLTPTPTYTNNTNAGTASAGYTYAGDSNHNGSTDTKNFTISKADSTTAITCSDVTYNGSAQTPCTAAITGVGGLSTTGTPTYSDNTNAGTASATYTYTGDSNHNGSTDTKNFTIAKKDITVTADAKGKNYGSADPTLTYSTSGSLAGGDTFSGELSRDPGEDVGTYAITQNTLALSTNYNLSFVGANFTIGQNTVSVTADIKTKVYGTSDPELTYTVTSGSLAEGDSFSGTLTRSTGENVGSYGITQGALSLNDNYVLSFTGNNLSITKAPLSVTATAKTKVYGTSDPELTYTTEGLLGEDSLSGSLARAEGEDVATYAITQGTLTNDNYEISFEGANLEITKANQTITFPEISDKKMGDSNFTPTASSDSDLPITFTVGEGSTCSISENSIQILAVGTCTVTASQEGNGNYNSAESVSRTFTIAELTHNINASAGTGGTISPSDVVAVADGSSKEFTITPNSGFHILGVVVDGESVGAVSTYTFSEVSKDHTISATFEANPSTNHGGKLPGGPSTGGKVLGAEKFIFTLDLKMGPPYHLPAWENEVKELQKFLNAAGYDCGAIDGKFGKKTDACVRAFQKANPPLKVDGIVGPLTRAVLNK